MSLLQMYRDDLLTNTTYASHTFTETTVGSMTLVEFKNGSNVVIMACQKLEAVDAYKNIRENLVGTFAEIPPVLTTIQRNALTDVEEGTPILNCDNAARENYLNSTWSPNNSIREGNFNVQGESKFGGNITTVPDGAIDVVGDSAASSRIRTVSYQDNASGSASLQAGHSRGSEGSATALNSGDRLGQLVFLGDDGTLTINNGPIIRGVTTAGWSNTNHGSAVEFYTVANNSTTQVLVLNLSHQGYPEIPEYTVATLPNTGSGGGIIMVTDETNGYTQAFSDGANWLRSYDRAVVS